MATNQTVKIQTHTTGQATVLWTNSQPTTPRQGAYTTTLLWHVDLWAARKMQSSEVQIDAANTTPSGSPQPDKHADHIWPTDEELTQLYVDVAEEDRALANAGLAEYAYDLARTDGDDKPGAAT